MSNENCDLNSRQRKFVDNLFRGMSQKEAYMEAGYESTGNAAESYASQLLRNPKVQRELENRHKERVTAVKGQLAHLLQGALDSYLNILECEDMSKEKARKLNLKFKVSKDILDRCGLIKGDKVFEFFDTDSNNQGFKVNINESVIESKDFK